MYTASATSRARSRDSAEPFEPAVATRTGVRLSVMPTSAPGTEARTAAMPRPWPSSRWWVTAAAVASSVSPGAWTPMRCPLCATTSGSFSVIHRLTRSPSASETTVA